MALSPNPIDLCVAADVKAWAIVQSGDTTADTILSRLITAMSREISAKLQFPILAMAYTEIRNGQDRFEMNFLRPRAFAVNSLTIDTVSIAASADAVSSGYQFDEDQISLRGYPSGSSSASNAFVFGPLRFNRGRQNVVIGYSAGWTLPNQANPIDWLGGAAYLYGATIKPTTNNAGNYIYVATNQSSAITSATRPNPFNQTPGASTTDGGVTWMNLGVTTMPLPLPDDITQACIELVTLRMKERTRVGELSAVTPGGLSVSYFRGNMPPSVEEILRHYKRTIPVQI